ncbi:iron chelate uptake ABC transporter family permease subunit [Sinorhizobium sp. BG8]|uniref:iron chelate uptake ABC transporter family permease subunit n=1 Tax=Sinorhizobium sp. BG8 TaxID=2613773 RepID=UPI00193E0C24|nr:iron chelate uptake ABC transporter family permease subunit [Sinorhizobium sp. BG8]QRM57699.1 iron chelate uptake ABC transporter family permease subunit [Sinorhizobium sp. BG8]
MKSAIGLLFLLIVAATLTLFAGVRDATVAEIWQALVAFDPGDPIHVTVLSIRLPRLVAGTIAGAGLGMAGTVMQALTRNPLADPGLLGVNSGQHSRLLSDRSFSGEGMAS